MRGNYCIVFDSLDTDGKAGLFAKPPAKTVSGRLRARFNITNGNSAFTIHSMMQGTDIVKDPGYFLNIRYKNGGTRLEICKGSLEDFAIIGQGSRFVLPILTDMAAQFEWMIDPAHNRVRLRGYVTGCDTSDFGALQKMAEIYDEVDPYYGSMGEGVGFLPNPDAPDPLNPGQVVVDDIELIEEAYTPQVNPRRIGPA